MKLKGWKKKLEAFLWYRLKTPFKWHDNDCCTFACDGVEAISGKDPAKWFRGKYKNRLGAFKRLREFSGGGLEEMAEKITSDMGYKVVKKPKFGDVVLMKIANLDDEAIRLSRGITIGIVCHMGYVAAPGAEGIVFNHNPEIIKAWRI